MSKITIEQKQAELESNESIHLLESMMKQYRSHV